jgi:hypothetical protein
MALQGSVAAKDRREPRDWRRSGVASESRIRKDGMFYGRGLKELLSMRRGGEKATSGIRGGSERAR